MIHVLFTGGTISMQYDAALGGNVPTHGGEALVALAPELPSIADVRVENWARMPACHLTPADLWRLRERVCALQADPAVDGVVITHGTDILEETAYLLDRTLAPRVPVVLTGAMRTSDHAEWDGARNLTDAVRVAADAQAAGRGALVVFAGHVWQGIEAVKRDTVALDAFTAPFGTALGSVHAEGVHWIRRARSVPFPPIPGDPLPARVELSRAANEIAAGASWLSQHVGAEVLAYERRDGRVRVTLRGAGADQTLVVDRVLALVGYCPDLEMTRELQVHHCYASEGTMKLAAALLSSPPSRDCLDQVAHGPESLRNPEPGFFVLGAKSYGRNPRFFLSIGHQQIGDAFALMESDRETAAPAPAR